MRTISLFFIAIFASYVSAAKETFEMVSTNNNTTSIIDLNDTVVFDLSQAITMGNSICFPVSILTDDTIYAMDFSFKYNQPNFTYDSTVDLTSYMQSIAFYNISDSTLRFSSYSLQPYVNNTPLVSIFFSALSTQLTSTDIFDVKVYLNGSLCTAKVIDPSASTVNELDIHGLINIYPNPASQRITIIHPENSNLQILNSMGGQLNIPIQNYGAAKTVINTQALTNGIYLIKIWNGSYSITRKVLIKN